MPSHPIPYVTTSVQFIKHTYNTVSKSIVDDSGYNNKEFIHMTNETIIDQLGKKTKLNNRPIFTSTPTLSVVEDEAYSYQVTTRCRW